jgi:hypothetical protein
MAHRLILVARRAAREWFAPAARTLTHTHTLTDTKAEAPNSPPDRSEYFRGLFRSGCAEVDSGRIAVHEASPPALRIALNFIYAGRLEAVATAPFPATAPAFGAAPPAGGLFSFGLAATFAHVAPTFGPPVLSVADLLGALSLCRMFLLPAGAQMCREAVISQLSPASAIGTLIWADAHADDALRSASLAFALSNFAAIREEHPTALEALAAAPRDLMLEVLRGLSLK